MKYVHHYNPISLNIWLNLKIQDEAYVIPSLGLHFTSTKVKKNKIKIPKTCPNNERTQFMAELKL